jgi:BRCA1-like protein
MAQPSDHPLANQVVVFTGKLSSLGRKEAQALVIRLGGSAADEVTAKTTLVVVGAESGPGAEKSQKQMNSAASPAFSRPKISSSSTTASAICSACIPGCAKIICATCRNGD